MIKHAPRRKDATARRSILAELNQLRYLNKQYRSAVKWDDAMRRKLILQRNAFQLERDALQARCDALHQERAEQDQELQALFQKFMTVTPSLLQANLSAWTALMHLN